MLFVEKKPRTGLPGQLKNSKCCQILTQGSFGDIRSFTLGHYL